MARGWRGNALGLTKHEVLTAHQARLDATEAIAEEMRRGKNFWDAKAAVEKRAASIYSYQKPYRPHLYHGTMSLVRDVQFSDMPKDVLNGVMDSMIPDLERMKGKPLSRLSKWCWRTFGVWW